MDLWLVTDSLQQYFEKGELRRRGFYRLFTSNTKVSIDTLV